MYSFVNFFGIKLSIRREISIFVHVLLFGIICFSRVGHLFRVSSRLLICVFLHLGSMRRPAAPLPTVASATENCAAVQASSPLSVTICLSHSFWPQIGQTSNCSFSFLPSTHTFFLFLGRGGNNLSPHFRCI